jgi:hypothetical protein
VKCPRCGRRLRVLDSRWRENGTVYRRRRCSRGHRVTTEERFAGFAPDPRDVWIGHVRAELRRLAESAPEESAPG